LVLRAQALVAGNQDHRALVDRPLGEQRMPEILDARGGCPLHPVQTARERSAFDGSLLRATHLRRRDHLHGARDLRGAADRADAPAKVARTAHVQVCLN
jgi:hypothetical protein